MLLIGKLLCDGVSATHERGKHYDYYLHQWYVVTPVVYTAMLMWISGVWTMIFGAIFRVEKFTIRKFMGVIASLIGIILISRVDLTSSNDNASDDNSGSFANKPAAEIALGDAMAAFSAVMYGIYTIVMKRQVGDESRVNMALFFGLVGFFNMVLIWPGFIIMHFSGLETFELPPTKRIWSILMVCFLQHFSPQKKKKKKTPPPPPQKKPKRVEREY